MKIEKVNDNQIRCTLTKADLADRQLKLSELAYGTEKAKDLFRDMMQQAAYEFGFEAEDIPLMIEAIPLSSECIILIITKVEYPEELDTRFSKFAPSAFNESTDDYEDIDDEEEVDATEVLDLFKKLQDTPTEEEPASKFVPLNEAIESSKNKQADAITKGIDPKLYNMLFVFDTIEDVAKAANALSGAYDQINTLWKDPKACNYVLLITKGDIDSKNYPKVCNIITEYASKRKCTDAAIAYMNEHFDLIVRNNALQTLKELN